MLRSGLELFIEPLRAVRQAKNVDFFERAAFFKNRHFRSPWSSGGVPGAAGDTADSIMGVPGLNSGVILFGSNLRLWRV